MPTTSAPEKKTFFMSIKKVSMIWVGKKDKHYNNSWVSNGAVNR